MNKKQQQQQKNPLTTVAKGFFFIKIRSQYTPLTIIKFLTGSSICMAIVYQHGSNKQFIYESF
jgi:hypothetical protein